MKLTTFIFCIGIITVLLSCEQKASPKAETQETSPEVNSSPIDTSNLKAFALNISKDATTDFSRSQKVVDWLAQNFDWTATDYKRRTVKEIIARKGGNCAELARVTKALLQELDVKMRRAYEVNHHVYTPPRQKTAEEKVKEKGNRFSVFGVQHNDHVWLEVWDETKQEWFPADPSIGVIGKKEWLKARLGFEERFTLDPSSKDMLFPMAIFVYDEQGKISDNRSSHYMVEGFDNLYDNQLSQLPEWKEWVSLLDVLDDKVKGAFMGEVNLHDYQKEIAEIGKIYERIKTAYLNNKN